MLTTLIALRHDQDWFGASIVLAVAALVALGAALDRWINNGTDTLARGNYDDRIHTPWPPKPAGGDR